MEKAVTPLAEHSTAVSVARCIVLPNRPVEVNEVLTVTDDRQKTVNDGLDRRNLVA